ncbi:MAG: alpha/beta hydrolase [Herbiconiux sp.]|nr:alpha/beta hydrolase [Herbiconiux sp.]
MSGDGAEAGTGPNAPRRTTRRRPALRVAAVVVAAALVLGASGFVVWANVTYAATLTSTEELAADPAVAVDWSYDRVVMTPTGDSSGEGLVFFAGAKVDPLAYAWKLSGIVEQGATVVIVRPPLNFALFEVRPLTAFTDEASEVKDWFVGGHSLGGVKACQFADQAAGLILLASYCAGDESDLDVPVLSVSGSEDGLSTPAKIDASRAELPDDARFVQIEGANHARFGDYGAQTGDGEARIDDERMRDELTTALAQVIPAA